MTSTEMEYQNVSKVDSDTIKRSESDNDLWSNDDVTMKTQSKEILKKSLICKLWNFKSITLTIPISAAAIDASQPS